MEGLAAEPARAFPRRVLRGPGPLGRCPGRCVARSVDVPPPGLRHFLRGDCNDDGNVNISDAVCILNWLFLEGAVPPCIAATNVDGVGQVNLTDALYLLNYLFLNGAAPPVPFPDCGPGALVADEELGCAAPPARCQE